MFTSGRHAWMKLGRNLPVVYLPISVSATKDNAAVLNTVYLIHQLDSIDIVHSLGCNGAHLQQTTTTQCWCAI